MSVCSSDLSLESDPESGSGSEVGSVSFPMDPGLMGNMSEAHDFLTLLTGRAGKPGTPVLMM